MEPIENYGLVGDCHGCALISKKANVDWLTFRRFDADPVCWSLLDDEKGATLKLHLSDNFSWRHTYLANTNILVTEATDGKVVVTIYDFMPVGRQGKSRIHDYTTLEAFHGLVRFIKVTCGTVDLSINHTSARWDNTEPSPETFLYVGTEKLELIHESVLQIQIQEEKPLCLVLTDGLKDNLKIRKMREYFKITRAFWEEWIAYSQYQGPHQTLINRSALTLKLLIHAETGAIMAAPTTSLPEEIGGARNWDYRFCWLRDATFTLYALSYLGFSGEADKFSEYIEKIIHNNSGLLKVLYNIDGEAFIPEKIIRGISGYAQSTPVRVGNDAYKQIQLDTHGEFMDWAYLHRQLGGELSDEMLKKVKETADWVAFNWQNKDRGLWEMRGEDEDFTYSKIMCWVALDRASSLLDSSDYQEAKKDIEHYIEANCIQNQRLTRSAQHSGLDASLLLAKIVGYPIDEEIYRNSVDAIINELGDGPYIRRYQGDDGLSGNEGAFIICSFWAVNACLFLGRLEQAQSLFERLLSCMSELGLLSEEFDTERKHFLGNFPQALSHLALIETASYFQIYQEGGKKKLEGCHGDRARSLHKTLHGPRAVWNFILKTGEVRKLFSSSASKLDS